MTKYWGVRAHKDIQDIVERDAFIGIGFGGDELGDLSGLSRREIRSLVEGARPDRTARYYWTAAGQLWRFVNVIEEGDCLLTPHKRTRDVRIGLVRGAYEFARTRTEGRIADPWIGYERCPETTSLLSSLGWRFLVSSPMRTNSLGC